MLYVSSISIKLGRGRLPFPLWAVQYCPKAGPVATLAVMESTHVTLSKECPQRSGPRQRLRENGEERQSEQSTGRKRERERTLLSCLPLQSPEPAPQPPHKQPFATASRLASSTRGWPCPRPLSRAAPRREQTRCVETEDPEVLASETSKLGQAVCLSGSFCFFLCEMK